jgi:hypothetical protein
MAERVTTKKKKETLRKNALRGNTNFLRFSLQLRRKSKLAHCSTPHGRVREKVRVFALIHTASGTCHNNIIIATTTTNNNNNNNNNNKNIINIKTPKFSLFRCVDRICARKLYFV